VPTDPRVPFDHSKVRIAPYRSDIDHNSPRSRRNDHISPGVTSRNFIVRHFGVIGLLTCHLTEVIEPSIRPRKTRIAVTSPTSCVVNSTTTIWWLLASIVRWSLRRCRRDCFSCFSSGHSPSPNILRLGSTGFFRSARPFVIPPVRDPIAGRRDVMAVLGAVFERHGGFPIMRRTTPHRPTTAGIGRRLHALTLPNQKTEAKIGRAVLNQTASLGIPISVRIK